MFSSGVLQQAWRLTHRQFPIFLAQITLHSFSYLHLWNLLINHPILAFIPFDALILQIVDGQNRLKLTVNKIPHT